MRIGTLSAVGVACALGFGGGVLAQQQRQQKVHPQTLEHLTQAMHGEGFAAVKYGLYADHARRSGHPEVADVFEKAAKVEREQHFAEEATLAGLVKSDEENIREAIQGETYESTKMYPEYAKAARAVGDKAAADRFEEIARDERMHKDAFEHLLPGLKPGVGGSGR